MIFITKISLAPTSATVHAEQKHFTPEAFLSHTAA